MAPITRDRKGWLMTAKKSRSTSRSAKPGTVTGGAKVGGNVTKTPEAKVRGAKMPRTKATGGKVAKAGSKGAKSGAGTIGKANAPVGLERVRVEKVPVTGRLVKLETIDRDGARVLEQVITGASEVTISAGSDKTATLTGALLSVLRNVAAALERGESVTVLGEDAGAYLEGAVISSQEAADLLNVSRPFVVKLAKTGQLAHHMVGNRHRFNLADVLAYAEQMRTERSEALAALAPAGGYTVEDF
jgi:excisionase family DNA binding protein